MAPLQSEDFKRDAVRIATQSGLTRRQVASDLGVEFPTLGKWIGITRPIRLMPRKQNCAAGN